LRIALFTYEYGPTSRGGVGRYLDQLVPFLRGRGVAVDIFHLHEHGAAEGAHHVDWVHLDEAAGTGELIRRPLAHSAPTAPGLPADAYDLVLCEDWHGVVASEGLWRRGVRLIYTCHLPLAWEPDWRAEIDCQYADQLETHGFVAADAVLTVSHSVRRHLEQAHPYTRGKVHVVHNGVDDRFHGLRDASDGPGDVAFVGRLVTQKGIGVLPEVFARLAAEFPERGFHVIGGGRLEGELREGLAAEGIAGRCTFHGHVGPDRLAELYARTDVLLLPSTHEPFGIVALEAMDAGVAVVASDVDGFAEMIVDGESGYLVKPGDAAAFAGRARALLADDALRARISAGGAARVREAFTAAHTLEATLEVLRRVAAAERAW
jgi:1,4-alpha-glucan branching enzyme